MITAINNGSDDGNPSKKLSRGCVQRGNCIDFGAWVGIWKAYMYRRVFVTCVCIYL